MRTRGVPSPFLRRECVSLSLVEARDDAAKKSEKGPALSGAAPQVLKALSEYVAALVRADGGELYLVTASQDYVHLHLTGTCAGCPGATMTREQLLEPAIHSVVPRATLKVTTGWTVPEGAKRVD